MSQALARLVAAALHDGGRLDELATAVGASDDLAGLEADVLGAWTAHGATAPAAVADAVRRSLRRDERDLDPWTRGARWVAGQALAEPSPAVASVAAPSGDWRALAEWARDVGIVSEAAPALRDELAARVHELFTAVMHALTLGRPLHAARIARVAAGVCRDAPTRARLASMLPAIEAQAAGDPWPALHVAVTRTRLRPPAASSAAREARDRLRAGALAWVRANLPFFAMEHARVHEFKAIGELAMAAELLARVDGATEGAAWLDRCWKLLGEGRLLAEVIVRSPEHAVLLSTTLPYSRTGRTSPALRDLAARLPRRWDASLVSLWVAAAIAAMGINPGASVSAMARSRPLALQPPAYQVTNNNLYDMTHTVFLLTAMGLRPDGLPLRDLEYLHAAAPLWLELQTRGGHLDLLAELVATVHCAGAGCVPDEVWQTLAQHQRADGSVPFSLGDERGVGDYHSTLTSLMAALLCDH